MDRTARAWVAVIASMVVLLFSGQASAAVIINEIMANPTGDENAREYIELLNTGVTAVVITNWRIGNASDVERIVALPGKASTVIIPAGGYAIVFDPDYFDSNELYASIPSSTTLCTIESRGFGRYGLINSRVDTLILRSANGIADRVSYTAEGVEEGLSLERVDPTADGMDLANWAPSHLYEGTPGAPNHSAQPTPEYGKLRVGPNVPEMSATIEIEWPEAPVIATVRIYDHLGWTVRDLVVGQRQPARVSLAWDGRDDRDRLVQTGRYVVLAEAVSVNTGRRLRLRGTVVLAQRR